MKQNKKGFTLIELLAVIVILAIIALIATPIILNMIKNARKSAAKSSTLGFVDSVEYYADFRQAQAADSSIGLDDYEYDAPAGTCTKAANATVWANGTGVTATDACKNFMGAVESKSKGKAPDSGSVTIDANGRVTDASLVFGQFTCDETGVCTP